MIYIYNAYDVVIRVYEATIIVSDPEPMGAFSPSSKLGESSSLTQLAGAENDVGSDSGSVNRQFEGLSEASFVEAAVNSIIQVAAQASAPLVGSELQITENRVVTTNSEMAVQIS